MADRRATLPGRRQWPNHWVFCVGGFSDIPDIDIAADAIFSGSSALLLVCPAGDLRFDHPDVGEGFLMVGRGTAFPFESQSPYASGL